MKLRVLAAALLFSPAWAQRPVINPGFEVGSPGSIPAGWGALEGAAAGGYRVELTDAGCYAGARCAILIGPPNPPAGKSGNLFQVLSANGYQKHMIRVSADISVEGAGVEARVWLRIDRDDQTVVSMDQSVPIKSAEWQGYSLTAPVPADASKFVLGIRLSGPGLAWVDNFRIDITGDFEPEAPKPVTSVELRNLTAFAKLYGYVRFFHPSDQAAATDWQQFAIDGAGQVQGATDDTDLLKRLNTLFAPIAPTVRIYQGSVPPGPAPDPAGPDLSKLFEIHYEHKGVGLPEAAATGDEVIYRSTRVKLPASGPLPSPLRAELVPGLSALVPMDLYANAEGTFPHVPLPPANPVSQRSVRDRVVRFADIVIAWNVLQHFYPYFDVAKADWRPELSRSLEAAAIHSGLFEYRNLLRRIAAALEDGQAMISGTGSNLSGYEPPVQWDWIEGQLIVTRVSKGANGVALGDRILAIDGRAAGEAMEKTIALISSATPQWARWRAITELNQCLVGKQSMSIEIEPFTAQGTTQKMDLPCSPAAAAAGTRPPVIAELEPGIFYLDLDRIKTAEWKAVLPKLVGAKGMIFDLRGYANEVALEVLAHLAEQPIRSAHFNVPVVRAPDRVNLKYEDRGWSLTPRQPHLGAPAVFLTDGRAISYSETVLGIVEAYHLATIVGQPTAGTSGNINMIQLPSGFALSFTGMQALKLDGSRYHGVGIQPNVVVVRTRRGVAMGQDEILMRGK